MQDISKMQSKRIELPQSSIIVRVQSLDEGKRTRKKKSDTKTATYRVILRIDVEDYDIIKSRGKDVLDKLKASDDDYLPAHIENEIEWLEQSFSHVETESVTRLDKRKSARKSTK